MNWIETRIRACEDRLEYIIRYLQDLYQQIQAASQAARTATQQGYAGGGGGGGGGAFFCQPASAVGGATGTWPSVTPASFTADVYSGVGGVLTKVAAGATVWNYVSAGLSASKTCPVIADGSGAYAVYSQGCT